MVQKRAFVGLDGLRGIAAVMVVLFHAQDLNRVDLTFPSAYLAVDLFFMLSGFVIAHAYEQKLKSGMSVWHFFKIRVIRLYPLYIFGTLLSFVVAVSPAILSGHHWLARESVYSLPFALLMIPDILNPPGPGTWFPLNTPAWSLFYEWVCNLLYAVLLPALSTRVLSIVAAISFVMLTLLCLKAQTLSLDRGRSVLLVMTLRPIFALSAGVLLQRSFLAGVLPKWRLPPWLPLVMFMAVIAIPKTGLAAAFLIPLSLLIVFPVAIILAVDREPDGINRIMMKWGGAISYPVYVIQQAIIFLVFFNRDRLGLSANVSVGLTLIIAIFVGWAAVRLYDVPVRHFLEGLAKLRDRDVVIAKAL